MDTDYVARRRSPTELARRRLSSGMSQAELSRRTGVSRSEISAIETGKLIPSVKTALALAKALNTTVEELFGKESSPEGDAAIPPDGSRVWEVSSTPGKRFLDWESSPTGTVPHDAVVLGGKIHRRRRPARSLVIAGCDPAVSYLADALSAWDIRLIPLQRGSRAALEALRDGVVSAAGIHFGDSAGPSDAGLSNVAVAKESLGSGYRLLRLALWNEGVAVGQRDPKSTFTASLPRLRWLMREPGSAARELFDRLRKQEGFKKVRAPVVTDHLTLAKLVKGGWADAGICIEFAASQAGIDFLPLRKAAYDLCLPETLLEEYEGKALLQAVRSKLFRRLLEDLPGYDASETGELISIDKARA